MADSKNPGRIAVDLAETTETEGPSVLEKDLEMFKNQIKMFNLTHKGLADANNPYVKLVNKAMNWMNVAANIVAFPKEATHKRILLKYLDKSDGEKVRAIANDLYIIDKESTGKADLQAAVVTAKADKTVPFVDTDVLSASFWSV